MKLVILLALLIGLLITTIVEATTQRIEREGTIGQIKVSTPYPFDKVVMGESETWILKVVLLDAFGNRSFLYVTQDTYFPEHPDLNALIAEVENSQSPQVQQIKKLFKQYYKEGDYILVDLDPVSKKSGVKRFCIESMRKL